jgi:hypothetical protein
MSDWTIANSSSDTTYSTLLAEPEVSPANTRCLALAARGKWLRGSAVSATLGQRSISVDLGHTAALRLGEAEEEWR